MSKAEASEARQSPRHASARTVEQVRAEFRRRGISIASWARARGFDRQLVYRVLAHRGACVRGESHDIAVALGLKEGQTRQIDDLDAWLRGEERVAETANEGSVD